MRDKLMVYAFNPEGKIMQSLRHAIRIFLTSLVVSAALAFGTPALAELAAEQANALKTEAASGDKAALKTLMTEAQKGDKKAQFVLGTLYHNGAPRKTPFSACW